MTKIPGTDVAAVFQPVTGGYPTLYYRSGETGVPLASMNAGNAPQLYVGGGGINAGFATALARQDIAAYATRHVALADETPANETRVQTFEDTNPAACMTICNTRTANARDYTGLAFLDAFTDDLCPGGNPANRAMAYVAPPDGQGYSDKTAFLADITAVADHMIKAISAHNAAQAAAAPGAVDLSVGALRLCMYSSGIYRMSGVSLDEVALAIFDGIRRALLADPAGLSEVQMPVGQSGNDPYFRAVQENLAG